MKQKNKQQAIPLCQNLYHVAQRCCHSYGFCANPNNTLQKNLNDKIKDNSNYTLN